MYARIISSRLRNFLQHSASSRLGSCTHSTMMYLQRPTDPPPRLDMTMTTLRLTHPPTHARLIPRIEIINDLFGISRNRGVAAGAAAGAARLSDSRDLLSCRCWCVSAGRVPRAQVRILRPTELTHFFLVWWLIVASRFLSVPSEAGQKPDPSPGRWLVDSKCGENKNQRRVRLESARWYSTGSARCVLPGQNFGVSWCAATRGYYGEWKTICIIR